MDTSVRIPLLRLLTDAGLGSRRQMADAIRHGSVRVNGMVAEDFRQPVDTSTDRVMVNGHRVNLKPRQAVYLMMNKPKGFLSTTSDEQGRRTVMDIVPAEYRHLRLYPVGRLDYDTTGLLLLTNDGTLTHRLTHPSFENEKEYLVQVEGKLTSNEQSQLEKGISLEDGTTYPAMVRETKAVPPYNYSITIHEGRKRQVRRMFAHLGYRVLALKRVRTGALRLANLKEGEVRQLTDREVKMLKEI